MNKKDGDQKRKRKQTMKDTTEPTHSDPRLLQVCALALAVIFVVIGYICYDNFVKQMFYPRSDPALLESELGENESLVMIQMISAVDALPVEDVYVRINNPATGEKWEYYTDNLGEVWAKVKDTKVLHVYQSKEGWHSEITNIVMKMGERNNLQHFCKPFEKIRLFVQVGNGTEGAIAAGAHVFFDNSQTPVITDEQGLAYIDLDKPRKVGVRVTYGAETYSTSYTVDDWWVWDKITIFFN